jgi:two-component system cell cycle response regulator
MTQDDTSSGQSLEPATKVLVVDRDPLFSRIVKSKLEKAGYKVQTEESAAAALEWFRVDDYRIVVTDFTLYGTMDGAALCRQIKSLPRPHYTYVLFYSSRTDKDAMIEALGAGADDFMVKPYNAAELKLRLDIARRMLDMDDQLFLGGGTDKSTGVINRAAFEQFFPVVLAQAKRGNLDGTLLFVRLTNLKEIFSRHGYEAAHAMVVGVSSLLRAVHRTSDLLAKTEEDEFCLLLQNTHWDKCLPVVQRIQEMIAALAVPTMEDRAVTPLVRLSALNYPIGDLTAQQILEEAERIGISPLQKSA